jgi:uncharacterized protein (TIGR03000 family)
MFSYFQNRHLLASLAVFAVGSAALLAAPPTDLKGFALQQYLNGQDWNSTPRPAPSAPYAYPQRSQITTYALPYQHPEPDMRAYVMAHLPEGAELFVNGEVMFEKADKPVLELRTPQLEKGMTYNYVARVRWFEDGKWVTQEHTFPVHVGDIHCIEVIPNNTPAVEKLVKEGMAKLSHNEKVAAETQKFCAVQNTIRLGSMGTPVKVTVGGKDVFLCCEGCRKAALKDPAKTAAKAEENKSKPVTTATKG